MTGLLHGSITTAILDRTIGRAVMVRHPQGMWSVTVGLPEPKTAAPPMGEVWEQP